MRLAIVAGIAQYQHLTKLHACSNDAETLRSFLEATKNYDDICFLDPATTGPDAKAAISAFVQKHRENKVEELFFYFSGHGDRTEDDFFYLMSDFKTDRRETAGLRNSELDSLIRNISPELTIKIVDACYSGSSYIKAEDDIAPVIQKSAKDNQLNKLYFFYSSAADQTSLAGPKFSLFTLALLQSLVGQFGPVRYRDLIAAVADEMNRKAYPRPTFVVQADNLETFVQMDTHLSDLLKTSLGLANQPSLSGPGSKESENAGYGGEDLISEVTEQSHPTTLAELAAMKAKELFCTEKEAETNIRLLDQLIDENEWPGEIRDAYEITVSDFDADEVPNSVAVGKWVNSLKDDPVFAVAKYETQTYTVEEYKEVPKKPSSLGAFGLTTIAQARRLLGDDKEYKLESVQKTRQVMTGFRYTVAPVFEPRLIGFSPKHPSLEHYAACVLCLFSRKTLTCLYSIEHLPYTGWSVSQSPTAGQWKQLSVPLKQKDRIIELIQSLFSEIAEYIESDARQRLS
ncbi:caspase family protein [Burkholderia ubonensis]|uniref:caspase family protein n=1 Tax=Burkholderia ubonensis TaxID=101571 RepID=UPI000AC43157|nr:caspase family protein [Burkholderia ubonensis]